MNTELTTTKEQTELIQKKRNNWADLGEAIHHTEQWLIDRADEIKKSLVPPTTIDDITLAESYLKSAKSELNILVEKRKTATSRFDGVSSRLMNPEKSLNQPIIDFTNAIITLKKEHEKAQADVENKIKEIIRVKENVVNQANVFDAECKKFIAKLISDSYSYALGAGNISTVDMLKEYLEKVSKRVLPEKFIFNAVKPSMTYVNEKEFAEIIEEINLPTDYVALFSNDLKEQFSDYETAWHNKEVALANKKKEDADKAMAIENELLNKNIAAKLDAIAVPIEPTSDLKALKKSYIIDLPETMENSMKILGSFIANYAACSDKLRITKAFNFSVNNAIKSLEALKNNDNSFDVSGLVWKEVSKL